MKWFLPCAQKNERRGAFPAVGQGVGHLEIGGGAGFLHVIAGDGDRVELGHLLRGELEDVGDDSHRRLWRIDIGVAHHVFLENVILNGAGELLIGRALLEGGDDVEREDGQHRAVHGHRDGHLVERDAVEEHLHVEDRINGDAGLTDIPDDARVVGIIAAMGGEVEGDGETLLPCCQVAAIECVGFLGSREPGILADRPGLEAIHGGIRTAQERGDAGLVFQVLHARGVRLGI